MGKILDMIGKDDRCLIVEDNFIIRMDLEDILKHCGFEHADQTMTLNHALQLVEATAYRFVLLDLRVGGRSTLPLIELLKKRHVAFAVTTGYGVDEGATPLLQGVPMIPKPYSVEMVKRTVRQLLSSEKGEFNP